MTIVVSLQPFMRPQNINAEHLQVQAATKHCNSWQKRSGHDAPNISYTQCINHDNCALLSFRRLFQKVVTQHKSKQKVPSQREAVICGGARAQFFKTDINDILRHAPFLFTSRPSVIDIFHAKHASGGSQAVKVKVLNPLRVFV